MTGRLPLEEPLSDLDDIDRIGLGVVEDAAGEHPGPAAARVEVAAMRQKLRQPVRLREMSVDDVPVEEAGRGRKGTPGEEQRRVVLVGHVDDGWIDRSMHEDPLPVLDVAQEPPPQKFRVALRDRSRLGDAHAPQGCPTAVIVEIPDGPGGGATLREAASNIMSWSPLRVVMDGEAINRSSTLAVSGPMLT